MKFLTVSLPLSLLNLLVNSSLERQSFVLHQWLESFIVCFRLRYMLHIPLFIKLVFSQGNWKNFYSIVQFLVSPTKLGLLRFLFWCIFFWCLLARHFKRLLELIKPFKCEQSGVILFLWRSLCTLNGYFIDLFLWCKLVLWEIAFRLLPTIQFDRRL